jgi:hypothetical protein
MSVEGSTEMKMVLGLSVILASGLAMAQERESATELVNLRWRCADLGGKILEGIDAQRHPTLSQVSHYDPRTNRCYVEITEHSGSNYHRYLYDGQTKEILARASTVKGKREGVIVDKQRNPTAGSTDYFEADKYIDEMMAEERR